MDIIDTTKAYEAWAHAIHPLIGKDLALKHRRMKEAPFLFLRATYYHWAASWAGLCPDLAGAPKVMSIGDLHVENFGTWRDGEGRLAWGVNDFDEAWRLPYAHDLVRLAASVRLARAGGQMRIGGGAACAAILDGYATAMKRGSGQPFVLEEDNGWLRDLAMGEARDPAVFWKKLLKAAPISDKAMKDLLAAELPGQAKPGKLKHRQAGLGSLGRQRFLLLGDWCGAKVAREAKRLYPSANAWANNATGSDSHFAALAASAVRARDPSLKVTGGWVIRRLAPHCLNIPLADFPRRCEETQLLTAMGAETANVHLGQPGQARAISADLAKRPEGWLNVAARTMADRVAEDWERWRRRGS